MEDALGERTWADIDLCRTFVENILTVFGTRLPTSQQLIESGVAVTARPTPSSLTVGSSTDLSGGKLFCQLLCFFFLSNPISWSIFDAPAVLPIQNQLQV